MRDLTHREMMEAVEWMWFFSILFLGLIGWVLIEIRNAVRANIITPRTFKQMTPWALQAIAEEQQKHADINPRLQESKQEKERIGSKS